MSTEQVDMARGLPDRRDQPLSTEELRQLADTGQTTSRPVWTGTDQVKAEEEHMRTPLVPIWKPDSVGYYSLWHVPADKVPMMLDTMGCLMEEPLQAVKKNALCPVCSYKVQDSLAVPPANADANTVDVALPTMDTPEARLTVLLAEHVQYYHPAAWETIYGRQKLPQMARMVPVTEAPEAATAGGSRRKAVSNAG